MRWDYDVNYRDKFDEGPHRDILIVPHATRVTPVPGSQPLVESKVPKFAPGDDGQPISGEYSDVEFVITNEDIIKESFEYTRGISSGEKLSYGACQSAMVKFKIRNAKSWNEAHSRYELDIPDLQKIEVESDDGTTLLGEVESSAIIEVYQYINGDSSTLMWLGMFRVEQDKVSDDGYNREIVAYDFMLTFRDMDIYEWYKGLFKGVPKDSDDPSQGYVKDGKNEWTIGEALNDLLENFAYLSPKYPTITNPKDYLIDLPAKDYPGYGMPIVLDPDLTNPDVDELVIPSQAGVGLHEKYGYMPILNLPFHVDEKIIKKGSYSCGKFLEDIAILAGRFGMIRRDIYVDGEYVPYDPEEDYHYNHYEKCILTFRPIDKKDGVIVAENTFDNSDIQKGFQHDYYDTQELKLIDITNYDNKSLGIFCPTGLTKDEKDDYKNKKATVPNLLIAENTFTSYLKPDSTSKQDGATYSDKDIIDILFNGKSGINDGKPMLNSAFNNMIYRPYRPYQLTSFGDLCREPGDRIEVSGIDKITGEAVHFTSYILECSSKGIQKMMDTYTAKGSLGGRTYSDYRAGESSGSFSPQSMGYGKYGGGNSGSSSGEVVYTGITQDDYCEIVRNEGRRFLDEPTKVKAVYSNKEKEVHLKWKDPVDLEDYKPIPCAWEGTLIVRKEGSAPRSPWDGATVHIVNSTTRDEYLNTAYVDNTVAKNKIYYYGFFPYYTILDDADHPLKQYRFTKIMMVDTTDIASASQITKLTADGTTVNVKYKVGISSGTTLTSCKIAAKKGSIPKSISDADISKDINAAGTSTNVDGLDENSKYYFVIFTEDSEGKKATSDAKSIRTTIDEGYNFAYTGSIQTFTAPKTGIYQLETWGAQGGNAEDSENNLIARGGYGAYAVGEILLTQGETIYINVGGQNGYGGGGLKIWDGSEIAIIWSGENNKLTAQISNNSILFKMYSGDTVIYSFTSQTGTSVSDIIKINAGFLIDTEQEVAKPSFIYDIGSSSYKYNSETPTDAEMADIYTWLTAGLPSN